jgi:hypothetical protein
MVSHPDPPFGPECMNNISRFLSSYISAHILDERNAVAANQPINSIPGGFINIRLVRHPQGGRPTLGISPSFSITQQE